MNILNKAGAFFRMDMTTKWLLVEAYFYLAWARYLKVKSFSKVAPALGEKMAETTYSHNSANIKKIKNISNAIRIMSRYTFWESECLVKAMAGMKMLEKRQIESTLYLGTAKEKSGEFVAHAWLRSGSFYVSGSEGMERFTVVAKFAKEIGHKKLEGENYG
ncbi:lasso peptide biosynthesis B2 protein [Jeotgalibacillus soli]|uniref:Stage V sporulation protein S n=1 Tax=Jeotgalibacillus soli TaxID=889306 RepID=A0A0C2VKF1_9BACL|nr:lasso peptide biosynthesis B2 protein [Jeotgalibacillus soli]KIL49377.1 stage V sporulation protein S [Jeotgalibacillus soli]